MSWCAGPGGSPGSGRDVWKAGTGPARAQLPWAHGSPVPAVPIIRSLGPSNYFQPFRINPSWPVFILAELCDQAAPFHTHWSCFGVAHMAAGGEGGSVIYLPAPCASWEGKISHSGAFVNRDSFAAALGWLAPGSGGSPGHAAAPDQCAVPTVWTPFHCLLSCPGLLSGVSSHLCPQQWHLTPGLCWHRSCLAGTSALGHTSSALGLCRLHFR